MVSSRKELKVKTLHNKTNPSAVIRVDSSVAMGSGHLMRCLTLADVLRESGAQVTFICRELPGNLIGLVESKGFRVRHLVTSAPFGRFESKKNYAAWLGVPWQTDAAEVLNILDQLPKPDWLIVDNYALDIHWEKRMRNHVGRIMVIDDLADRHHDCDLLLDQNLYEMMETRYNGLVPDVCIKLLGPCFALLRPEFREARKGLRKREGIIRRILVFFGGSDLTNQTAKALEAIKMLKRSEIAIDVVVGSANPHKETIESLCKELPNASYHCQIENIAELMAAADVAIGAGGSTTWERCSLGLPTVVITLAENQVNIATHTDKVGVLSYLGKSSKVRASDISRKINAFFDAEDLLICMSEKALHLVDGGGAVRLVDKMEQL